MLHYEMQAYHGLAIVNFNLSDLDKCNYYVNRFLMGKSENDTSMIKSAVVNYMTTRMERKKIRYALNTRKVQEETAEKFNRLPSPATQSKGIKGKKKNRK